MSGWHTQEKQSLSRFAGVNGVFSLLLCCDWFCEELDFAESFQWRHSFPFCVFWCQKLWLHRVMAFCQLLARFTVYWWFLFGCCTKQKLCPTSFVFSWTSAVWKPKPDFWLLNERENWKPTMKIFTSMKHILERCFCHNKTPKPEVFFFSQASVSSLPVWICFLIAPAKLQFYVSVKR